MIRLLYRLGMRPLCLDRRRSSLSVVGVALGVALLFSVNLATSRAREGIREQGGLRNLSDLEIVSRYGEPVPDEVYARLLQSAETVGLEFMPVVTGQVDLVDRRPAITIMGIDLVKLPYLIPLPGPTGQWDRDHLRLGEAFVMISESARSELGLVDGETIAIGGIGGVTEARVHVERTRGAADLGPMLVGDIAWVRPLQGMQGRLTSIQVRVRDGDPDVARAMVEGILAPDLQVQRPDDRILRTREVIRAFNYNLTALSFMALLVGMFLVYNTVAVSAVRRRTEMGVLRALGMRRVEVILLFLCEAGAIGAVGSLLGVAVGAAVGGVVSSGINGTLRTLYDVMVEGGGGIAIRQALGPVLWGMGGALTAGLLPALEASRAVPAETVREGAFESRTAARHDLRAVVGAFLVIGGAGIALFLRITRFPFAGFGGILILAAGFVLTSASLVRGAGRGAIRPLARLGGTAGRFAAEGVAGRPRRAGMAVASIGLSLGCALGILLLTHSFRTTVERWVNGNLSADLYLKPAACQGRVFCEETLDRGVIERLRAVEGVEDVYAFRGTVFMFRGKKTHIGFSEVALLRKYSRIEFFSGRPRNDILSEALEGNTALVSEPFAYRFGLAEGDTIEIPAREGNLVFRIGAVYRDYSTELGYVILDRRFLSRILGVDDANTLGVYFDPAADAETIRERVAAALDPGEVFFLESRDLRTAVLSIFDRTFAVTEGIYLVALAIALLGVVSTFSTLILDRRRELSVLRYLGMERKGIFRMLLFETSIVAGAGCVLGLLLGVVLGLVLVFVINRQSFGWSVDFAVPLLPMIRMVLMMGLASAFSAWWPYRGAMGLRPADWVGRE